MTGETATRLMESIAADRLVILCGAGLSMARPSGIPSAADVAAAAAEGYHLQVGQPLPAGATTDLEAMARWFLQQARFLDLFIPKLVPWARFNSTPNAGHEAVADFLASSVVHVGITTNFDCLVEIAARHLGEPDFLPIVEQRGLALTNDHRPYLKAHGCSAQFASRLSTVWCADQLNDPDVRDRLNLFRTWMQANLRDRDLLVVGFWSDWAYLTDILADALTAITPRSVTLVDPASPEDLELKAPKLWSWMHSDGIHFYHERESGADFLDQLRKHFSRVFLRHAFSAASATHQQLFASPLADMEPNLGAADVDRLYALRRDFTSVPRHRPVRAKLPAPECQVHAALHARLISQGAVYHGHTYVFGEDNLRLINGAGRLLSQIKRDYDHEPPLPVPADTVICIGATIDGAAANVVRPEEEPDIIRGGVAGRWTTEGDLLTQLGAHDG